MRGLHERKIATVFGGSGFIGRYVVQRLAMQDYVVRVVTRDPDSANFLHTQGRVGQIVPLGASLSEEAAVGRAVVGAQVVVNLLGILAERRAGDFRRIHADAAGLIARCASIAGVRRVVHVSAIGADAASPSLYAQSKAAGEAAMREAFPGVTILRPSVVFGPEDQFFNRFAAMARLLPFMPVVSGGSRLQPVFVGDVADAAAAAIADEGSRGRVYELGGPRVMTMREVLRFVLEATRRRKPMIDMPMGLMRTQARLLERLPNPPITQDQLLLLGRDNVVSDGAAGLADFGIQARAVEAVVPGYLVRFRPGGGRRG